MRCYIHYGNISISFQIHETFGESRRTIRKYLYMRRIFMNNHEIDFKLHGDDMQFVEVELDPGETVVAEAGSLMMMEDGIEMETIFGDGSGNSGSGLMGKLMGAG